SERVRQKSGDLRKQLMVARDRVARKLAAQQQELLTSRDREQKKQWGDIISTNIYQMEKGNTILRTVNFFSDTQETVDIPLDPMLTPSRNAQRYYSQYRKAVTAEAKLHEFIASGEHELAYLETVLEELLRAESDAELAAIREEATAQGYTRPTAKEQGKKPVKLAPNRYLSSDGFTILSGRNNVQNDQLTLKDATNYDMWLHTQKIAGSHTIIITDGCREIPPRTLEEAAIIAACNSSARDSSKVPVDYTYVKNVKKPRGAKPGMVIYETYQTAIVDPDRSRAEALRVK
ncbi:MAG: NFACT family protein, partial [Angelakisella sp.]